MARCPNCSRTFLEDRLAVHLKSCSSANPHKGIGNTLQREQALSAANEQSQQRQPVSNSRSEQPAQRQPGSNSRIGQSAQQQQNHNSNQKAQRQPGPSRISQPQQIEEYDTSDRVPCRKCGRGFNSDRINYHQSVCKGPANTTKKVPPKPARKPQKRNNEMPK